MNIKTHAAAEWTNIELLEPTGEVIAVNVRGDMIIGHCDLNEDSGQWQCENEGELLEDVSHWMPLPTPPKK